jgi:hypothetical protein
MSRCSDLTAGLRARHRRRSDPAGSPSAAERAARLDGALADYRDATYAEVSPLADRRIVAELRAAPKPALPDRRVRYGVAAVGAVAASVAAVVVALSTLGEPGTVDPGNDVLLAAATPGGDRGPFAERSALQRCLEAARIPLTQRVLLGAGPVHVRGSEAVALLLPGPSLGDLTVLAVTPQCAEGAAASVLITRTLPATGRGANGTP